MELAPRSALARLREACGRPFRSLSSRIVVAVFTATMVTSLAVTWTSTRSIESFLFAKIEEKFPSILRSAAERLDLWYAQRQLDVATFARSATMADNVELLVNAAPTQRQRARHEIEQYLSYVLERFAEYETLLLVRPDGSTLLRVGREFALPEGVLVQLAGDTRPQVSDIHAAGQGRVQVAAAPVGGNGRGPGSAALLAVMRVGLLAEVLRSDELGSTGGVYVVGAGGEYLVRSRGAPARGRYAGPIAEAGMAPQVQRYESGAGEDLVGGAVRFGRFEYWSLAVEEPYQAAFAPVVVTQRGTLRLNLAIVVAFCLIAFAMARSIVHPIEALSEAARRVAAGDTDVVIPEPESGGEIRLLTRTFNEMTSRLQQHQNELHERHRELQSAAESLAQLSITDELTRLHNHRYFQDQLPMEMDRSARSEEPLSLILADIDDFKALNDRYGHAVGDQVLRHVADVMNFVVRGTDLLTRYGGEEFALLAPKTDEDGALTLGEKLRLTISQAPYRPPAGDANLPAEIPITVSVGVAVFRGDERAFFNDADRALYRAKSAGKDCVVCADEA